MSRRVIQDEAEFAKALRDQYEAKCAEKPNRSKSELNESKKRFEELDDLIRSLYENFAAGLLPERQYRSLMNQYAEEQDQLEKRIQELEQIISLQQSRPLRIRLLQA